MNDALAEALHTAEDLFPSLTPEDQRIALSLMRQLANGHPVETGTLARATDRDEAYIARLLDDWHGVIRDAQQRVTGFWGLSLTETVHRMSIADRDLYAWCAWDTLFLPELLGMEVTIHSRCPQSGGPVSLRMGPDGVVQAPANLHMSFIGPAQNEIEQDIRGQFCCHIHFFTSPAVGTEWVSRHPGTSLLSLEEALLVARRHNRVQYGDVLRNPSSTV